MAKRSIFASISLVAIVLGLLLAVQFRVSNNFPNGIPRERTQELAGELRQLTGENETLQKEIYDLKLKLEQVNAGRQQAVQAIQSELDKAKIAAGIITVTGPGVEVILDNPQGFDPTLPAELSIIRDDDLLKVVNELRAAGTEALSLNGHRITPITEIRLAGSFINVNTKRVVPPYQILAIGDPDAMEEALTLPGGLLDYLGGDLGIEIKIKKHEELTVPAYSGDLELNYAKQT
ncbi:MAG: DUF881 domain-containing protein [Firmicutes bacterium]|nr:DUF881 domain-containing protein [Bacillota bacterium]